ncbi:MAG: DUF4412 domain-containing protein [Verrucomicrobia bacterium]|nr:DUF4412 domain-containing protein [Verrucomicrobiota bacterium]
MARTIQRLLSLIALVAVVFAAAAAVADVTITMENEMTTQAGTQTTTVVQYYTPTKMRNDFGEANVMIVDLDEKRMVTLIVASKMFLVQTFDALQEQAALIRMAEPKITIEETDEQAEINGYTCHKVVVRTQQGGDETVTENWVAKDVKGIDDVEAFLKSMYEAFEDIPQQRASMDAGRQLAEKGLFPIRTVVKMGGPNGAMTATMTVTKIEEGDLDEELFEIPDDYTEMSMGGFGVE